MVKAAAISAPRIPSRSVPRPLSRAARHIRVRVARETPLDSAKLEELHGIRKEDFVREFDKYLSDVHLKFEVGQRVEGLVFDVDGSGVLVDFGGKETGFCSNNELALVKVSKPSDLVPVNSRHLFEIGAIGVNSSRLGGVVTLLRRSRIVKEIAFKRLRQMSEFQIKFPVEVLQKNAGGYVVRDEMGVEGFLPGRQTLANPAATTPEADELVGETVVVKVLDLFEDSSRLVVTQRGVLDSGIDESLFKPGNVLEGVVEGVMPYGVFIHTGGVSGLLHMSQISEAPVEDVESVFSVNDRVKVMVLGYDRSRGRLALSTRKLEPTSGDMLRNPQLVYERAEEMAAKFREEMELAAARMKLADVEPIGSDVSVNVSRLMQSPDKQS